MPLASTDGANSEVISVAAEVALKVVTVDLGMTVRVEMTESV